MTNLKNRIKADIREVVQKYITEYKLRPEEVALILAEEGINVVNNPGGHCPVYLTKEEALSAANFEK